MPPQCGICLRNIGYEEYLPDDSTTIEDLSLFRTPCGHVFCARCIAHHCIYNTAHCPTCRLSLRPPQQQQMTTNVVVNPPEAVLNQTGTINTINHLASESASGSASGSGIESNNYRECCCILCGKIKKPNDARIIWCSCIVCTLYRHYTSSISDKFGIFGPCYSVSYTNQIDRNQKWYHCCLFPIIDAYHAAGNYSICCFPLLQLDYMRDSNTLYLCYFGGYITKTPENCNHSCCLCW